MSKSLPLDQQVLHVYVALQNLAHGRAVNDIADEIGRSRFATARMVRRARELGLVEVRATVADPVDVELSARLAQRFGLQSALVVATYSTNELKVREAIAAVTARVIVETIEEDDVVGFTPGRTLVLASRAIAQLPCADVVQLTGIGLPRLEDGVEVISNVGRAAGGATYPLYAPILIEPEARAILKHPVIQHTLARFDHVTKAFLTIGGWPSASLLAQHLTETRELDGFAEKGVIAEYGTSLLDETGRTVPGLEGRFVGIAEEQLRDIGLKVAIGGGEGKERAVSAVLRSGMADIIITDVRSAQLALQD
ncbi:MAG: sugar-binding transcriptional regulator [Microbacteriaceae bacterium]|uniref:sugar-binding transcriptional regulator n=1 Tax=Microbacterium sp. TaxID=51671 RepID=UPI003F98A7BD